MFNEQQLEGILLTIARPEVTVYRSDKSKTGWTIRARVMFRANRQFLFALQRKFEQLNIKSILREKEGVNRQAPVLIVGKNICLNTLRDLMPKSLPCSHADWAKFDEVMTALSNKTHLETDGMNRLIQVLGNETDN